MLGEVIEALVQAFPEDLRQIGLVVLQNHGIRDADLAGFYQAQPFLDAMRDVAQRMGRNMMTRIGERIALRVKLPPKWDCLEAALGGTGPGLALEIQGRRDRPLEIFPSRMRCRPDTRQNGQYEPLLLRF